MIEISLSKFLDIAGLTLTNDEYDTFQAAWVSAHNLQVGDYAHDKIKPIYNLAEMFGNNALRIPLVISG